MIAYLRYTLLKEPLQITKNMQNHRTDLPGSFEGQPYWNTITVLYTCRCFTGIQIHTLRSSGVWLNHT